MDRTKLVLVGMAALAVAGGILGWSLFFRDPAAATPTFGQLSVREPNGNWEGVGPNPSGNFEVLPSVFPNAGLRFFLYAPYPTALSIDLDGQTLPDIPSAGGTSATGYFRVLNVNTSVNPAQWELEIQPPDSKMSSAMMTFKIADVSLNPRFTGTDHISNPITVILVARKLFSVSIALSGMGTGEVTSQPPGIICPTTCAFDFGQSVTVTLTPNPTSGSTFAGWSGACESAGSVGNCTLTLNGTAMSVGAVFRPTSVGNTGPGAASCNLSPNPPTNYTFFTSPLCPASALGSFVGCNSQGYVCCADSTCSSTIGMVCPSNSVPLPSPNAPTGCFLQQ
jgi:Divergent InlB B-repeat domain